MLTLKSRDFLLAKRGLLVGLNIEPASGEKSVIVSKVSEVFANLCVGNVLERRINLRVFTGFLRGRVRPARYTSKPGQAPNIYFLHFYELYYLLFHYGFEITELRKSRVKFAAHAEKDPIRRRYNWQILSYLFHPALLLSDNIIVKAKKL